MSSMSSYMTVSKYQYHKHIAHLRPGFFESFTPLSLFEVASGQESL